MQKPFIKEWLCPATSDPTKSMDLIAVHLPPTYAVRYLLYYKPNHDTHFELISLILCLGSGNHWKAQGSCSDYQKEIHWQSVRHRYAVGERGWEQQYVMLNSCTHIMSHLHMSDQSLTPWTFILECSTLPIYCQTIAVHFLNMFMQNWYNMTFTTLTPTSPPWELYGKLHPGTLVLVNFTLYCWIIKDNDTKKDKKVCCLCILSHLATDKLYQDLPGQHKKHLCPCRILMRCPRYLPSPPCWPRGHHQTLSFV